ncbi:PQ loop repeat-domain-containing protein [Terfezia claveryi]|nr:PQ loop repeat-domain-containing protein [Terfezia claveryi]
MSLLSSNLSTREIISGISGSISLASWILLLVPQLIENFRNGNAEGISTTFLLTWLVGDIANLVGSIWANLLPTVIALALYYCFADFVLLSQVLYYNQQSRRRNAMEIQRQYSHEQRNHVDTTAPSDPTQPLLPNRESTGTQSITYRRQSASRRRDSLSALIEKKPSTRTMITRNLLAISGTCLAGILGWFIAWKTGAWKVRDGTPGNAPPDIGAEILGYISAVLYLSARIPQIIQNHRKKSCEGHTLTIFRAIDTFFMLSLLGNFSYGAGILFHSTEGDYVMANLAWLIGSLGTMAEDAIIFYQFSIYRTEGEEDKDSAIV